MPEAVKTCADCQQDKSHDEFYRYKAGRLYPRCKPCHYAYTQAWRARNRSKIRELDRARYPQDRAQRLARKRLAKYGLTQDQYDALIESQQGACPICLEPLPVSTLGIPSGDWSIPSVDHCHETGAVRGILHRRCNLALEFLLSDEEIQRARNYLRGQS